MVPGLPRWIAVAGIGAFIRAVTVDDNRLQRRMQTMRLLRQSANGQDSCIVVFATRPLAGVSVRSGREIRRFLEC